MLHGMSKTLLAAAALICGILAAPAAHAQAPSTVANVWTPPAIGFDECMRLASQALRQAGSKDVSQKTTFAGMGFNQGHLGDYTALIMCITFKGTVAFFVAGLDAQTAENYRLQLNQGMGNR